MSGPDTRMQGALAICDRLKAQGYRALLAGGCVRDFLLHIPPADIDIATDASPDAIASLFTRTITVGAHFGVMVVIRPEGLYEVAAFRRDGPYLDGRHPSEVTFVDEHEDAQRRDFTINAMFLEPETFEVLDYVGGRKDLEHGIIRAVGDPHQRFREDYLRLLRAVRFAARFRFQIEDQTEAAMRGAAPDLLKTSAERIRDELIKMLTEGGAREAFVMLDRAGLLEQALPEVRAMKKIEQPPVFHPEGDVFEHTLLALEQLSAQTSPTLALAVLLHDVGKPETQTFEDRIRFNSHEKVGARMAETICRRLRMSARDTERVAWLVENHMRLASFMDMREHRRRRFARSPGFEELIALCRIDALASHGDLGLVAAVETYLRNLSEEDLRPEALLTGRDLIDMGYKPGPRFKKMLGEVESLQLDGILKDADGAREFVRHHFPSTSGGGGC